jgi:histidinol-phosphate aminotransferase
MDQPSFRVTPAPAVEGLKAYQVPRHPAPIEFRLDGNEGAIPPPTLIDALKPLVPEVMRNYPSRKILEQALAARFLLSEDQVLVTCGGDDALERACRSVLAPGRQFILPVPTFEMLPRYGRLSGAETITVPWETEAYPLEQVLAAITEKTAAIAIVSPNNPNGAIIKTDELVKLAQAAPRALLIVDLAYIEFADEDITSLALSLPNAVVMRTFSKVWGMAGLRVGYALGPAQVISWMKAVGNPYSVSGPSLALAKQQLDNGMEPVHAFVKRVRSERSELQEILSSYGEQPTQSQGNFVFFRSKRATWLWEALAGVGIAVRRFATDPALNNCLRITCPGNPDVFPKLRAAIRTALAPQALFFDLDGVLADASKSYRQAIVQTAASYGEQINAEEIAGEKAKGNANNDWALTQKLLKAHGRNASLEEVTERFEKIYQGTPDNPGLCENERLLCSKELLAELGASLPLAIVTGRPRADAERFLLKQGIRDYFALLVCMEDAPLKPDPAPVRLALEKIGKSRAWLVGDTPDDICSARDIGVIPIGIAAPGEESERTRQLLLNAGAARVLNTLDELKELVL